MRISDWSSDVCSSDLEGGYWLRLKSPADAAAIEAQLPAWEKRNIPDENDGVRISNPGEFQDWKLVNIRDVHLGEAQGGAQTPGNDKTSIVTFAVIALLILDRKSTRLNSSH